MYLLEGYERGGYDKYCRTIINLYAVSNKTDLGKIKAYIDQSPIDSIDFVRRILDQYCKWIEPGIPTTKLPTRLSKPKLSDAIPTKHKEELIAVLNFITSVLPVPESLQNSKKPLAAYHVRNDIVFDPSGVQYATCINRDAALRIKDLLNKDLAIMKK